MSYRTPSVRRHLSRVGAAVAACLALVVGGAGAAHAEPVAPPVVAYTYAGFVVPTPAQNGGATYVPVQGLISGAGASFSLADYSVRMICNGASFYPLSLTTHGGGSISFSGSVPETESLKSCLVTASSRVPGQLIDFQPSQTFVASEFLPTAVVNIAAQIVNHSVGGGL